MGINTPDLAFCGRVRRPSLAWSSSPRCGRAVRPLAALGSCLSRFGVRRALWSFPTQTEPLRGWQIGNHFTGVRAHFFVLGLLRSAPLNQNINRILAYIIKCARLPGFILFSWVKQNLAYTIKSAQCPGFECPFPGFPRPSVLSGPSASRARFEPGGGGASPPHRPWCAPRQK